MPFHVDLQPGETLFIQQGYQDSRGYPFAMAVTNQAVYLPKHTLSLSTDGWSFQRTPLAEVVQVELVKQSPIGVYIMSTLMILLGVGTTYMMLAPLLSGQDATVSGWPIAILVGGLVVPFIAGGRKTLIVTMKKGKYKWRPPMAVDKATRTLYAAIFDDIKAGCAGAGIQTIDAG